ncbi:MAG: hypothetical protein JWN30_851 [Bacilli bacterium]|nr:hypothetical protein [Bacilli bacterium]
MSHTKRITPGMVVEAFRLSGLIPVCGNYFIGDKCASGLGAMYFSAKHATDDTFKVSHYVWGTFGINYSQSFSCGFDNKTFNPGLVHNKIAYADGLAAWHACVEEGLVQYKSSLNIITTFAHATRIKFCRVDDDGSFVFEHDLECEVGFSLEQLEALLLEAKRNEEDLNGLSIESLG